LQIIFYIAETHVSLLALSEKTSESLNPFQRTESWQRSCLFSSPYQLTEVLSICFRFT